jgi:hypothetical protein
MTESSEVYGLPSRWILPTLGAIAFLFTLLNGVPWVSKTEYSLSQETRAEQWRAQFVTNDRLQHDAAVLQDQLNQLEDRVRALENAMGTPGLRRR